MTTVAAVGSGNGDVVFRSALSKMDGRIEPTTARSTSAEAIWLCWSRLSLNFAGRLLKLTSSVRRYAHPTSRRNSLGKMGRRIARKESHCPGISGDYGVP